MADGINTVILGGNIGSVELKKTQAGKAVLNISMATKESYFDATKKERVERTSWHRVVVWDKHGEALSKILKVGMGITVQGKLQTRSVEKDGEKRYYTDVVGEKIVIGGSGNGRGRQDDGHDGFEPNTAGDYAGDDGDTIPF
jgi:single-strand DNA-binding protein